MPAARTARSPHSPRSTPSPSPARLPDVLARADIDLTGVDAEVLALPLASPPAGESEPQPRAGVAEAVRAYGVDLAGICATERFTGAAGQALTVPLPARDGAPAGRGAGGPARLLLIGVGDGGTRDLRRAGAALGRAVRGVESVATTATAGARRATARAFVEGLLLGSYTPPWDGRGSGPKPAVRTVRLLGCRDEAAVHRAKVAATATWRVRDLTNTPSSIKNPSWVADRARALAAGVEGLTVEVMDAEALQRGGFGGLVAVGAGSATPPCLVTVTWTPPASSSRAKHVVLVGKGITYDTGGISIKPREAMVPMKTDMAGAAVVLAAVLGAAELVVPHRVTALLPLAENAFSGSAYRPGDVVTVYGGTTVEIVNTDAEGRMVLADALAHADADLAPDVLVDVATLTGAASLGLGRRHAAMYTADSRLAAGLEAASQATGEHVWRMPLVEDYRAALDSQIADICHVVQDKRVSGGSITAALFLREFVGNRRWVHLDVAGPARAEADEHEVTKGASGYGARLLLEWLTALR